MMVLKFSSELDNWFTHLSIVSMKSEWSEIPTGFSKYTFRFAIASSLSNSYLFSWATLADPPNQFDAYKWEVKRINLDIDGNPMDANFDEPFGPVFDDEFFDGMTFDFFYDNPFGYEAGILDDYAGLYELGDTIVIKFSKIDENVYEFLEKKYIQLSTAGNPFATPTNIPNNISGDALGIWAGYSPTFDTLVCQP